MTHTCIQMFNNMSTELALNGIYPLQASPSSLPDSTLVRLLHVLFGLLALFVMDGERAGEQDTKWFTALATDLFRLACPPTRGGC